MSKQGPVGAAAPMRVPALPRVIYNATASVLVVALLTACARSERPPSPARGLTEAPRLLAPRRLAVRPVDMPDPSASVRLDGTRADFPKGGGVRKLGTPYQIAGRWYVPRADPGYDRIGIASWYGEAFHGRRTANGEIYDMEGLTAAHPTLPLPSLVTVTNLANGRTLLVRVNDRGPYAHDRLIDLSRATARLLDMKRAGTAEVRVRYVGPAPLDGDGRREVAHLSAQPWFRQTLALSAAARGSTLVREPARPAIAEAPSGWNALAYRRR